MFNLHVIFFQIATKLLGHKYLISCLDLDISFGQGRPWKKLLRHWGYLKPRIFGKLWSNPQTVHIQISPFVQNILYSYVPHLLIPHLLVWSLIQYYLIVIYFQSSFTWPGFSDFLYLPKWQLFLEYSSFCVWWILSIKFIYVWLECHRKT